MVENLDKLIERDGKIEVILQKAESLSTYSKTYRANVSNTEGVILNAKFWYIRALIKLSLGKKGKK